MSDRVPSPSSAAPTPGRATPGRWTAAAYSAWGRYGGMLLAVLAVHAAVTAVLRWTGALEALVLTPDAPVDLLIRMDEVRRWFSGVTIYDDSHSANYPPASYTLLWPLVGWLPELPTRVLYALSIIASVAVIAAVSIRASGATTIWETAFAALFILPLGATQITIWIGQLGLHVTACLLGAMVLLLGTTRYAVAGVQQGRAAWIRDVTAAALLTISLVKPTLSVPVVVVILIVVWRWRPALLTGAMYLGLTALAAAFQDASTPALLEMWLGRESIMNLRLGSVNTHFWLYQLGFERSLMLPASLVWLVAAALWAWRCREADPWIVAGVAALIGRLWIHHRTFDDVLLVIPAVALFRIAKASRAGPGRWPIIAALLLAAVYGLGHAPWSWVSGEHRALWLTAEIGRTVVWLGALGFLLQQAHRSMKAA